MKKYPNIRNAEKIWCEGIKYRELNFDFNEKDVYIFHSRGVAYCCQEIAKKTKELDEDKAYVLGLLHDYGKRQPEKLTGRFHGQEGYDVMNAMSYPDVARICLTHSFYAPNFNEKYYKSYKPEWLSWAKEKMLGMEFNDYDYLVQLCDMFFEDINMVNIKERMKGIVKRYSLTWDDIEIQYEHVMNIKNYFDKKCNENVYKLLNITC